MLIYDQTCAAEKRRRRKRGKMVDPAKRTLINAAVCEGCGDCGVKSNCVSVLPMETEFGRKREIDQSNCNKDFRCVKGFCPSFVTVHGGGLQEEEGQRSGGATSTRCRRRRSPATWPSPGTSSITGIGGTGVVTIGALLGMAAHLERKGAQRARPDRPGAEGRRGHHARAHRASTPADIHAVRIAAGEADLVLGCDMVVVNDYWALSKIRAGRSHVVLNTYEAMPGTVHPQHRPAVPGAATSSPRCAPRSAAREPMLVDATELATALMGDAIATNLFMLGYAWQQGLVPLSLEALMRAIELNGAAVEMNKTAFAWGRLAAHDLGAVQRAAGVGAAPRGADFTRWRARHGRRLRSATASLAQTLDEAIALPREVPDRVPGRGLRRAATPRSWQRVRAAEAAARARHHRPVRSRGPLPFKLMAYKDEYEVARLYTTGDFEQRMRETFDGDFKLHFNLAPPLLREARMPTATWSSANTARGCSPRSSCSSA